MKEYYYTEDDYTWQLIEKLKEPPVLLYALSGFIDAGFAAGQLISTMLKSEKTEFLVGFSPDKFMNYRERRGLATYENGVLKSFNPTTPRIDLCYDLKDKPFLLLYGPEPDFNWEIFSKLVVKVMKKAKCQSGIGFFGMPAPVPHTRNLIVTKSSTKRVLLNPETDPEKGFLSLPTNAGTAIEWELKYKKIPGWTYSVKVPSYLSGQIYPEAAILLADKIEESAGLQFNLASIKNEKVKFNNLLTNEMQNSDELEHLAKQFESAYDNTYYEGTDVTGRTTIKPENLPTGDELSKEIEDYLKAQKSQSNKFDSKIFKIPTPNKSK